MNDTTTISPPPPPPPPRNGSKIFETFMLIYDPVTVIPSIFGSALILVALWNRRFQVAPKTTSLLLSVLMISNLVFLTVFIPIIYIRERLDGMDPTTNNVPLCYFFMTGVVFLPFLQMYCHVLLSLERCLVVICPLKAKIWITLRRVIIITCFTVVFVAGTSSLVFFRTRLEIVSYGPGMYFTYCFDGEFDKNPFSVASVYLTLIFWQTLPLGLMTIFNLVIIVSLFQRYRENRLFSSRPINKHTRLTVTLVIMTFCITIYTLPTTALTIVQKVGGEKSVPVWLNNLRWITFHNTFISDWIILFALSTRIRKSVRMILRCRCSETEHQSLHSNPSHQRATQRCTIQMKEVGKNGKSRQSLIVVIKD